MVKHTHNLSQLNPVATAALNPEFKAHDKTSYPFKRARNFPKYHKIILRSTDKQSGTNANATFNIKLPNNFSRDAVLVSESFYMENEDSSALATVPYSLHLRQLMQPNSYTSATGNATDALFTTAGYSYVNSAQISSLGIPIVNGGFFNNNALTIYFSSTYANFTHANDWTLTLAIVEPSTDEFT
jgi:hypothetical protein